MTVLMYDGVNALAAGMARQFPHAQMVAYYIDGRYAWSQAEIALFPHAEHVTIAVRPGTNAGDVLDVEPGDALASQAGAWIDMRHAAGLYRPTVYCNLSTVPAVRAATGHRILGRDYDIWVALYDGATQPPPVPGLPPAQFAAKQFRSTPEFDVSMVYDDAWPHRQAAHPAPVPVPAPAAPSGTATEAVISWRPVPGAADYRYQWRDGAGHVLQALTAGTHAALALTGPGPHSWRVQAGGGAWTAWLAIG